MALWGRLVTYLETIAIALWDEYLNLSLVTGQQEERVWEEGDLRAKPGDCHRSCPPPYLPILSHMAPPTNKEAEKGHDNVFPAAWILGRENIDAVCLLMPSVLYPLLSWKPCNETMIISDVKTTIKMLRPIYPTRTGRVDIWVRKQVSLTKLKHCQRLLCG